MSRTVNKVILIGNVGKDPDTNFTATGVRVAHLRLATTETWKDKDGAMQEHTDWHTIVAWRGLAEVVEKLVKKGSRLYVEGKLQSRSFEDRDGNKRTVVEVVADHILVLDARKSEVSSDSDTPHATGQAGPSNESEIPF